MFIGAPNAVGAMGGVLVLWLIELDESQPGSSEFVIEPLVTAAELEDRKPIPIRG